jgi:hypothetical protein
MVQENVAELMDQDAAENRRVPLPDEPLAFESKLGPIREMWSIDSGIEDDE